MDQFGKFLAQHRMADAPFVERARLEILDQDVGPLKHLKEHRAAAFGSQIESDRTLVAVDPDKVRRILAVKRRPPVAHLVACRRLDLDDVSPMVGENLRAIRPTQHARQIDDAQAGHGGGGTYRCHAALLAAISEKIPAQAYITIAA